MVGRSIDQSLSVALCLLLARRGNEATKVEPVARRQGDRIRVSASPPCLERSADKAADIRKVLFALGWAHIGLDAA